MWHMKQFVFDKTVGFIEFVSTKAEKEIDPIYWIVQNIENLLDDYNRGQTP